MVGYDNISDDNFRLLVDFVATQLTEKIQESAVCESETFLKAYNRFQEDERECADYIYDPDDNEDMVALLKGGYKLREIASVCAESFRDDQFCYIIMNEERWFKRIEWFDVVNYILCYVRDIVTCAFLYRQVEEYRALFEEEIEPLIVKL